MTRATTERDLERRQICPKWERFRYRFFAPFTAGQSALVLLLKLLARQNKLGNSSTVELRTLTSFQVRRHGSPLFSISR
jgi:hypothetical protein